MGQDLGVCLLTFEFPASSPETTRGGSQHTMRVSLMTEAYGHLGTGSPSALNTVPCILLLGSVA